MFDDYLNRPNNFIVENFCRLDKKLGRMGIFYAEKNYLITDLVSVIAEYSIIWD